MEDIRKFLNIIRTEHTRKVLVENIDDTTKNSIVDMFKNSVDETTSIDAVSVNTGIFKATGMISLELRFDMTINNNDNETICNIWFTNNMVELTQSIVDILSKLFGFFSTELREYVRQNLI